MIHVIVRERDATAQATEPITSGSVGLECSFRFSEDWDSLGKVAIFQGSGQIIDVHLAEDRCAVPHEVLQSTLGHLKIGVYGTGDQGQRVTPTIWADAGRILPGVEPSEIEPTPATQSLVQQILEAAENAEELAQSVRDDADAGEFDGEPGPKGDKGDPGESGLAYYHATVFSDGTTSLPQDMPTPLELAETYSDGSGLLPVLILHDRGWLYHDTVNFTTTHLDLMYSQYNTSGAKLALFEGTFENRDGSGPWHVWVKGIQNNGRTTWTIGKEALGGGGGGAVYFPFTVSGNTVTPGTGVTAAAIYQAYDAGHIVCAKMSIGSSNSTILQLRSAKYEDSYNRYTINFSGTTGSEFHTIDCIDEDGDATWSYEREVSYNKKTGGIPKTDLASAVQASLGKADTALQSYTETDPTVPSWAKASSKPSYTASEVGALPASTAIPSKTSDLTNDSGFINASGAAAAAPVQSVNGQTGAVTVQPATDAQVQSAVDDYLNDHPTVTGTFTNEAKNALLALLEKVAYIDENGQSYLDTLESELFAVAVTSISAVFTQGSAVIYDTDSLETLKQYLVVTATYSDSTTDTVTAYTLSGTLTEGTSTITVSYSGKTTTFNVTVTANPVYGFIETGSPDIRGNVLYPESDTGSIRNRREFSPSGTWKLRIKVNPTTFNTNSNIFMTADASGERVRSLQMQAIYSASNGLQLLFYLSSNGSSWDIKSGTGPIQVDGERIVEFEFTGSQYRLRHSRDNGSTWSDWFVAVETTTKIFGSGYITLGTESGVTPPFKGSIDLTDLEVWQDGVLWWKAVQN